MNVRSNSTQPNPVDTWADHTAQEFVHKDVGASMATMTAVPHVICVPIAGGGRGWSAVREFYAQHFIGRTPQDTRLELLSRTEGRDRLVDEMVVSFTHDIEMPWILPGIAPTGRPVKLPLVAVIEFRDGKIASEHLYWDQATLLAQIGVLATSRLPGVGVGQATALTNPVTPLNALLR